MVVKTVLFVCAQALLMQSISAQCIGAGLAAPWAAAPWTGAPCGVAAPWASHGGGLPVASASAIPPNGVGVASENSYCGELAVRGALPFLGTVGLEGVLPTAGGAAVAYGCGNGNVAMLTEDIGAAGFAGPLGYGAGLGGLGASGYGIGGFGYDVPLAAPAFARSGCGIGLGGFY